MVSHKVSHGEVSMMFQFRCSCSVCSHKLAETVGVSIRFSKGMLQKVDFLAVVYSLTNGIKKWKFSCGKDTTIISSDKKETLLTLLNKESPIITHSEIKL
jgi:hypothetical protein